MGSCCSDVWFIKMSGNEGLECGDINFISNVVLVQFRKFCIGPFVAGVYLTLGHHEEDFIRCSHLLDTEAPRLVEDCFVEICRVNVSVLVA